MMTNTVPGVGYRLLRDESDYQHMADISRAANAADGIEWAMDAATIRVEQEHQAGHDPRRDIVFAELDGQPIAYGVAMREMQGNVAVYHTGGKVRPEVRHNGI